MSLSPAKDLTKSQKTAAAKVVRKIIDKAFSQADERGGLVCREEKSSHFFDYEMEGIAQFRRGDVVYLVTISYRREDR